MLEHAPLWAVGLVLFAVLAMVHELAALARRRTGGDRNEEGRGYLVSSALGLLALMMGFTFSAAQSRFDLRQQMVALESNTMGTAYLRTQIAPSPWREQMGARLAQYAEVRSRFPAAYEDTDARARNYQEQGRAQAALWAAVGDAVRANPAFSGNIPLIGAVNAMFDAADERLAAHEMRVPLNVLRLLTVFMLAVAGIVGFASGQQNRNPITSLIVLALMTMAFCIILDLDRPGSGAIQIRQAPLERTIDSIRQAQAARAKAPAP